MSKLPLLLALGALIALTSAEDTVVVPSQNVDPEPEPHSPFTVVPNPNTPTEPTTIPTKPTTPTPPTKPTTPSTKPTTPSTKPTTPTPPPTKPTTPTPPPTKPTTPPTPPPTTQPPTKPTTTPAPTPAPAPANIPPPTGDWNITYGTPTSGACIFAKMAIQIEVPYHTKFNKSQSAYVDVPKNATASGNCEDLTENLKLSWGNNSVEFEFDKNAKTSSYTVDKVLINLANDAKNFPDTDNNATVISLVYKKQLFNTTNNMSYKCTKVQTFNLTLETKNDTIGYFHVGNLQLQAFAVKNSTGFGDAIDCEPAGTPDIVPIAAGCALAALIIIVLGAYLIGRRRTQARGYLSMFTETKREEDYIPMKNLSCFN